MKAAHWLISFPWSESAASALRAQLPSTVTVSENAVLREGNVVLEAGAFALLPKLRRVLRAAGVEPKESSLLGQETAAELSDATLVRLWSPKPRGNDATTVGEHPVEERRCEACDVTGFATREGDKLEVRLAKNPEDGIVLFTNAGGIRARPEPRLVYAMSAALRDALEAEGLLSGLSFFEVEILRRPKARYFGILPERRLAPMATPHGTNPSQRNCSSCGYVNARDCIYPLYPRQEIDADWFLAPPWGATSIFISQRVFAWLSGPGRDLLGAKRSHIGSFRAGFWPEETERAFLATEFDAD